MQGEEDDTQQCHGAADAGSSAMDLDLCLIRFDSAALHPYSDDILGQGSSVVAVDIADNSSIHPSHGNYPVKTEGGDVAISAMNLCGWTRRSDNFKSMMHSMSVLIHKISPAHFLQQFRLHYCCIMCLWFITDSYYYLIGFSLIILITRLLISGCILVMLH
jgi:hypothetical protein